MNAMTPALQEIDAETQIFTPPYVAKYLTQNSVGRLWVHSHPNSRLTDNMGWYVDTPTPEGLATVSSPEEIRVLDPACGTGNLLVEAFDLLYNIYVDARYKPAQIPALILEHNLVGYDIDPHAVEAARAILTAKAHEKDSHFFRHRITPNVRALTNADLQPEAADLFGTPTDTPDVGLFGTLVRGLDTTKYHVILANPPYMGSKHFTPEMRKFAKEHYPDTGRDLCTMFMERSLEMLVPGGLISMVTMESWMFLSSFETFRKQLISDATILTLAHLGRGVFGPGAVISVTAFVIMNAPSPDHDGVYLRVVDSKHKQRDLQLSILESRGQSWEVTA